MDFDPRTLAQDLVAHGNLWADRNSAAEILEETRKTLRAQIAQKYLTEGMATNRAELSAEASKEYIDHLHAMTEARRLSNRARVQYDADRAFIDLVRSQESTKRAEMLIR